MIITYVFLFFLASSPSRGEQNSSRYRNSDRPPSLRLSWMGEAWPSWLDCGLGRNHQAHRRLSRCGLSCQTVTRILEVSKLNYALLLLIHTYEGDDRTHTEFESFDNRRRMALFFRTVKYDSAISKLLSLISLQNITLCLHIYIFPGYGQPLLPMVLTFTYTTTCCHLHGRVTS